MFEKDSWSKRVCPGCALFHKHSVRSLKRCPKRFCSGMECLKADNVMWPFRNRRCACNAHQRYGETQAKDEAVDDSQDTFVSMDLNVCDDDSGVGTSEEDAWKI